MQNERDALKKHLEEKIQLNTLLQNSLEEIISKQNQPTNVEPNIFDNLDIKTITKVMFDDNGEIQKIEYIQ